MHRRIIVFTVVLLLLDFAVFAQDITATTTDGRKVLLKTDGTWAYAEAIGETKSQTIISTKKSNTAQASLVFKGNKVVFWYDSNQWIRQESNDPTKYQLNHKDGDVFAIVIAERLSTNMEALKNLALGNARRVAPDVSLVAEEDRTANETTVHVMMRGTVSGADFRIYGYYYTGSAGTVQAIALVPANLVSEYEDQIFTCLNGLEIKQ